MLLVPGPHGRPQGTSATLAGARVSVRASKIKVYVGAADRSEVETAESHMDSSAVQILDLIA